MVDARHDPMADSNRERQSAFLRRPWCEPASQRCRRAFYAISNAQGCDGETLERAVAVLERELKLGTLVLLHNKLHNAEINKSSCIRVNN